MVGEYGPWFLRVCSTSLLKTLWEKEKLLVTSNFSFSHSVFYRFRELSTISIKSEIVVCKLFQFGSALNLAFGKGLTKSFQAKAYSRGCIKALDSWVKVQVHTTHNTSRWSKLKDSIDEDILYDGIVLYVKV